MLLLRRSNMLSVIGLLLHFKASSIAFLLMLATPDMNCVARAGMGVWDWAPLERATNLRAER